MTLPNKEKKKLCKLIKDRFGVEDVSLWFREKKTDSENSIHVNLIWVSDFESNLTLALKKKFNLPLDLMWSFCYQEERLETTGYDCEGRTMSWEEFKYSFSGDRISICIYICISICGNYKLGVVQ